MSRAPVLVTGGAGFIGCHLIERLLSEGERVRVLDNLDPLAHPSGEPPDHFPADAELIRGDLRSADDVAAAIEGCERVFHLGGIVGNGESMVNVRKAVDANSGGTATLLEQVIERRDRIRRVVVASSMVVYGEGSYECAEHGTIAPGLRPTAQLRERRWEPLCPRCGAELTPVPVAEDRPLRPASVYGISKRDTEELALVLGEAYGFEAVALRYLNVYGPRQALGNPYTGVAAIFSARLLAGRAPRVFEDGAQIRDLVHVSDVVAATRAAMEAPGAAGRSFNVATGRRVRIAELAASLAELIAPGLEPEVTGEFRAGDIRHCFASTEAARNTLGFEPQVSLADGLPELAEWVASQTVAERGDEAVEDLRRRGLVG
ncbi:MAG TPA: NAD-dependent epimerase/dehydratase family protein [Solirubrobacterales bacterium]|nr:NAD-dependent epimerase/dehydratase family protein [Solirubrobacterales bacterium]